MRLFGLSVAAAALLTIVGCGGNPAGSTSPTTPEEPTETPVVTPPTTTPGTNPGTTPGGDLATIARDVSTTYKGLTSLKAEYENRTNKGSQTYYAKVAMTFAKPRKLRLDIKQSSDALLNGAIVVWLGGNTIKGRKDIGPIPIKQEHKLSEKANLRGWQYNQTDYDAMVNAFLANSAKAKVLGTSKVGGTTVTMVEFKSTLPGATIERVGIDTARKLPVYREFRESATGQPVFTTTYTNLVPNANVSSDAFSI
jgi:outer membrane lipoprotein-sorting protein